jgi:transglutaminase-like putative cysteine protease
MRSELERQRWLAALALVVALPLPLTGVAAWPFVGAFCAVAALVLTARKPTPPLRPWLENLLAPAILIAVVAAGGGYKYGVLRPVAHLGVLVAAVRMPGCGGRSRSRMTASLLAGVAVAGIASSTHPLLAVYLVGLLAFVIVAAARFVALSLAEQGGGERWRVWPPQRLVGSSVALAVLVAVPIFVLLPRLRSPFAATPIGLRAMSGFREAVALHEIGDIKLSQRVVMHVAFPDAPADRIQPDWLLEAGATMRRYSHGAWVDGRMRAAYLTARAGRPIVLAASPPVSSDHLRTASIELVADASTIFLPPGGVSVELPAGMVVAREPTGAMRPQFANPPVNYLVQFDPRAVHQPPPDSFDLDVPPGSEDLHALAVRMTQAAGNHLAEALAIEQHLQNDYHYSLSTRVPLRLDPVRWFLFTSHEGHCEFFASSMVLLLRTLGIPARLQAGFAGGERAADGSFIVRDSNAHAWVVAWIEGKGGSAGAWRIFDPTPPEGQPGIGEAEGVASLRLQWQRLETAWDRWVLTFSLSDQVEGARRVLAAAAHSSYRARRSALAAAVALALTAVLWRTRRLRRDTAPERPTAATATARAVERVAVIAARSGLPVTGATTPRELAGLAGAAFPAVAQPLGWLVEVHERSRYAGRGEPPRAEVRRAARAIFRTIRSG